MPKNHGLPLFSCLMADPPWPERGSGKVQRGANRHYPLLKTRAEILRVMVQAPVWRPAENAHLWMWSTNNYLPWAIDLIDMLGFTYKTNFPWVKGPPGSAMGIGQYGRGRHEMLLFAVRGRGYEARVVDPATDKYTWAKTDALVGIPRPRYPNGHPKAGRIIHSAKPPEAYALAEHITLGPRVDIFARTRREGWTPWGNEIEGGQHVA